MRRFLRSPVALLLLAAALPAQRRVWVVAPQPGVGVDFTSVQQAVSAAAPGDMVLIRDGVYVMNRYTFAKGVALVADNAQRAILEGNLFVTGLPQGQTLSFQDLVIRGPVIPVPPFNDPIPLRLQNCAGTVSLRGCLIPPGAVLVSNIPIQSGYACIQIRGCSVVQLEDCVVPRSGADRPALDIYLSQVALVRGQYSAGDTFWSMFNNGPGIIIGDSTVLVADVEVRGADSTQSRSQGGAGILVATSMLWLKGPRAGTIRGGDSGNIGTSAWPGGEGIYIGARNTVYLDGSPFQGGRGSTVPPGPPGTAIFVPSGANPPILRSQPLLTATPAAFQLGGTVTLNLASGPLEPHWILMSPYLTPVNNPGRGGPFWVLESPSWFVLTAFFTDAAGGKTVNLSIPNMPELVGAHAWIQDVGVLPGWDVVPSVPIGGVIR